jgi:urea transport system permease protein
MEETMSITLIILIQTLSSIAVLALLSVGLGVIFGMMRVMNLAHGELLMLGAYSVLVSTKAGINVFVSIFIIAPLTVGIFGIIMERLIFRHLYGRIFDTLLATWGLSLLITGMMTMVFGGAIQGITTPLGSLQIGNIKESMYRLFIIGVVIILFIVGYVVLKFTRWGLIARATMGNPAQASLLGVNPRTVYSITFGTGAALSGLAGAVLAPISGVLPTMGAAYVAKAFITVIGGGTAVLAGTASAACVFGTVDQVFTYYISGVVGEVALLVAAVILLRIMPEGITGTIFRRSM